MKNCGFGVSSGGIMFIPSFVKTVKWFKTSKMEICIGMPPTPPPPPPQETGGAASGNAFLFFQGGESLNET